MDTLQSRRSIRKYSSKDVSNHLLYQLLERAERTQTMGNLQLYSVVITRDAEQKKLLSPAHFHQPMVMQAPVVLTFCADFNRTTQWANNIQANPSYHNFLSFVNAASDALLYCQTFCQLAEDGTTLYNPQPIIDVLQLPTLVMPIATITLGYPDESVEQSERLPLQAIGHQETYQPYDAQRINECYAEKEGLEVNKNFVAMNKKETLAQVFTDIRYTKEGNEMFSKHLLDALKKQHFLD